MRPINKAKQGCTPTSSNCVVWEGYDLPGIELCTREDLSSVILKLTNRLSEVCNFLDMSNYDLSAYEFDEVPDFDKFLQILINKVAALENNTSISSSSNDYVLEDFNIQGVNQVFKTIGLFPVNESDTNAANYADMVGYAVSQLYSMFNTITNTIGEMEIRIGQNSGTTQDQGDIDSSDVYISSQNRYLDAYINDDIQYKKDNDVLIGDITQNDFSTVGNSIISGTSLIKSFSSVKGVFDNIISVISDVKNYLVRVKETVTLTKDDIRLSFSTWLSNYVGNEGETVGTVRIHIFNTSEFIPSYLTVSAVHYNVTYNSASTTGYVEITSARSFAQYSTLNNANYITLSGLDLYYPISVELRYTLSDNTTKSFIQVISPKL